MYTGCSVGDTAELERVIRDIAASLNLLGEGGVLKPLDSMTLIDLVIDLEQRLAIEIPPVMVSLAAFASIDAIVRLVERVQAGEAG